MHELDLTQHLLDLALEQAQSRRIVRVNLLIGAFSDEREQSIQCYWRDLAKGCPGESAEIHFEHWPVEMKCLNCGGAYYGNPSESICQFCSSQNVQSYSRDDVKLESVEVE